MLQPEKKLVSAELTSTPVSLKIEKKGDKWYRIGTPQDREATIYLAQKQLDGQSFALLSGTNDSYGVLDVQTSEVVLGIRFNVLTGVIDTVTSATKDTAGKYSEAVFVEEFRIPFSHPACRFVFFAPNGQQRIEDFRG
jgi:hypothetical protein